MTKLLEIVALAQMGFLWAVTVFTLLLYARHARAGGLVPHIAAVALSHATIMTLLIIRGVMGGLEWGNWRLWVALVTGALTDWSLIHILRVRWRIWNGGRL